MTRRTDTLRNEWKQRGYVVTGADLDRARARLDAAQPVDDRQHEANLAWLRQFDSVVPPAAA